MLDKTSQANSKEARKNYNNPLKDEQYGLVVVFACLINVINESNLRAGHMIARGGVLGSGAGQHEGQACK